MRKDTGTRRYAVGAIGLMCLAGVLLAGCSAESKMPAADQKKFRGAMPPMNFRPNVKPPPGPGAPGGAGK